MTTDLDTAIFKLLNGLKKSGERLQNAEDFSFGSSRQYVNTDALLFLSPPFAMIQILGYDIIR